MGVSKAGEFSSSVNSSLYINTSGDRRKKLYPYNLRKTLLETTAHISQARIVSMSKPMTWLWEYYHHDELWPNIVHLGFGEEPSLLWRSWQPRKVNKTRVLLARKMGRGEWLLGGPHDWEWSSEMVAWNISCLHISKPIRQCCCTSI